MTPTSCVSDSQDPVLRHFHKALIGKPGEIHQAVKQIYLYSLPFHYSFLPYS
ncbi:unnamed protein product [Fusarium fujikuroi]|nr:unnamed protein product [Fusarium fujikuroi]